MTTNTQVARAQALWLKVRAGEASEAERREYGQIKAAMWRQSRRG